MEPQLTIENIPFIWGIAFIVDVMIGVCCFMMVVRKNVTPWLKGVVTWCGWWSFASALSLIVSMVSGPLTTFSYHQIGIFTETMVNIGLVVWSIQYAFHNWYVTPEDWKKLEILRAECWHNNQLKELNRDAE